jgi:hypothetical protein
MGLRRPAVTTALCLLLSTASVPRTVAHLTTVCTSTAASQCADARVVFWLGTYHPPTCESPSCTHAGSGWGSSEGVPSGQVIITKPDGTSDYFNFSSRCDVSSSSSGPCPGPDLMTHCQGADLPSDAVVQCFTYNPTSGRAEPVTDTCQAMAGVHPCARHPCSTRPLVDSPPRRSPRSLAPPHAHPSPLTA